MRYQFILDNANVHPVEKMCKYINVSKNSYYHWCTTKDVVVETPKMNLRRRIRIIFEESKQIYGSCRIQKMLEREGLVYSRSYVAIIMKEMGLKSVLRRKYVVTTDSNHPFDISDNKFNRDFFSLKLGEKMGVRHYLH